MYKLIKKILLNENKKGENINFPLKISIKR